MYVSKRNLFFKSKENGYLLFCGNSNSFFQLDEENVPHVQKMFDTGDDSELPEDIKKEFIKTGVLLPESDEERFKRLKFISYQARFNPYVLTLTVAPTMACNFKCTYCYEGERVQNVTMSEEVIDGLIKFIKKHDCKNLNLTWYGGEPLCVWEKIVEITKRIEALGIPEIHYGMVTNGSLINEEIIKFIAERKFDYIQITLDGDKETHNKRRPMKNGHQSFDVIFASLDKIYDYCNRNKKHINVRIRVNLDKTNLNDYAKVYELIEKKYSKAFEIYPAFVFQDSESNCHSADCMSSLESTEYLLNLVKGNNLPASFIFPLKNRLCGCSIQVVNSFVIDSKGDIYRCWEEIAIKEKSLGNVITGFKDLNNVIQYHVMESSGFEDEICKDCLFLYSCMGGCPKHRRENMQLKKEINPVCLNIKNNPKEYLETYYEKKVKKFK